MHFNAQLYHRHSIRLKGYDYSRAGAYFVTICTRGRECVLDDPVVAGIIGDIWETLPKWFPAIALDEFVIMLNHVHLIVWLQPNDVGATLAVAQNGAGARPAPTGGDDGGATLVAAPDATIREWTIPEPKSINPEPALGDVIGAFKSLAFTAYLNWVKTHDPNRHAKFWQRNYYEHIIRNDRELRAIRQYIRNNLMKWDLDRDHPANRRVEARTVKEYLEEAEVM